MNRRNRQRIAYVITGPVVLPQDHARVGHRLGINSLALDDGRNMLFSAGRDGLIYGWEYSYDGKARRTSCWTQVQAHMHWINAISLVDSNRALVSASSDVSVKVLSPYSESPSKMATIGAHSDYVKALASPGSGGQWIAAGGLDSQIRLWDLEGKGSRLDIDNSDESSPGKGSVYALCANDNIILSGGPDNIVKLWDARVQRQATKFVGHTGNVRDILVSTDNTLVVSASSDRTVKFWSVVAGRCLTTLTMHNDSVWSLASTHPRLSVIYSGDKRGLVAKTDISNSIEPEDGISAALCSEKEGINDIVATDHDVWTATPLSSINRWENADISGGIAVAESSGGLGSLAGSRARISENSKTRSRNNTIPIRSALKSSHTSNVPALLQRGSDRPHGSIPVSKTKVSRVSVDLGTFHALRNHPAEIIEGHAGLIKHVLFNDKRHVLTMDTAGDLILWDLITCKAVQFLGRGDIDETALQINTVEQVPPWCTVDTRTGVLSCILEEASCFDAEVYADELNYPGKTAFKEDQRINLGKWILRLLFSQLIDEEMTRDHMFRAALRDGPGYDSDLLAERNSSPIQTTGPSNATDASGNKRNIALMSQVPQRPIMTSGGISTIGSPPTSPLEPERTKKPQESGSTVEIIQTTSEDYFATHPNSQQAITGVDASSTERNPYIPLSSLPSSLTGPKQDMDRKENSKEQTSPLARKLWSPFGQKKSARVIMETNERTEQEDYIQDEDGRRANAIVSPYEDRLLGIIREVRKEYSLASRKKEFTVLGLLNPPQVNEAPSLQLPSSTTVIIQEQRVDAAVPIDLFEGQLSNLIENIDVLETVIPRWVGDVILRNQFTRKEPEKVSFTVEPLQGLLPVVNEEGENERLTANRMLRVRKVLTYVAERLQKMEPLPDGVPALSIAAQNNGRPEDWLELICETQVLTPTTTLNTIRTHLSKSASDIVLCYRLIKDRRGKT